MHMDTGESPETLAPECARCRFAEDAWAHAPSYAFVVGMGTDVAACRVDADVWSATHIEPCVTAFCRTCRRVCWLARRKCAQAALLEHTALLASSAALDEHRLSMPRASACLRRVRATLVAMPAPDEQMLDADGP